MKSFGARPLLLLLAACPLISPAVADQKIVTRRTIDGTHATVETVYIRGERQRLEFRAEDLPAGGEADNNILIEQFDLRRTLQLSSRHKTYAYMPMDLGLKPLPVQEPPATRGGEVKVTIDSVDTGERKQVGGFTARHVRSITRIEAGQRACQPSSVTQVDGWYIDLRTIRAPAHPGAVGVLVAGQAGCRDRVHIRHLGTAPAGYPVEQTYRQTEQGHTLLMKTELLECSPAPLGPALFELPAAYKPALHTAWGDDFSHTDTFGNRAPYYWERVVYSVRRWF
jgi:hypothetical protein